MKGLYFLSSEESSFDFSFIFNFEKLKFIYFDPDFSRLLDLDPQDINWQTIRERLFADEMNYLSDYFKEVERGKYKPSIQFRFKTQSDVKWIRLAPFKLQSDDGTVIVANAEEITSEVKNMYTLEKYANKKNSLLQILAHDLRGPLSVAKSMSQVLDREMDKPELKKFAGTISKVVQQSIELINDLLAREVSENASIDLVRKRVDISSKLREYMEEYRKSEWMNDRTFVFKSSHEQIFIDLDESKFMQIINNFISNSLKFTRKKSTITLEVKDLNNKVLFIVSDDGIGIPKDKQAAIFQKFTDARRNGLNGEPTVGLGLYITKTIVEWHDGRIWFESEEDKGTTFFVEIPKANPGISP